MFLTDLSEKRVIVDDAEDVQHNIDHHPDTKADNKVGVFDNFAQKLHQFLHDKENNDSKYYVTLDHSILKHHQHVHDNNNVNKYNIT